MNFAEDYDKGDKMRSSSHQAINFAEDYAKADKLPTADYAKRLPLSGQIRLPATITTKPTNEPCNKLGNSLPLISKNNHTASPEIMEASAPTVEDRFQ